MSLFDNIRISVHCAWNGAYVDVRQFYSTQPDPSRSHYDLIIGPTVEDDAIIVDWSDDTESWEGAMRVTVFEFRTWMRERKAKVQLVPAGAAPTYSEG